jgi:hypothetical protein
MESLPPPPGARVYNNDVISDRSRTTSDAPFACRHCGVDLAHLPPSAEFCPHCGGALSLSAREAILVRVGHFRRWSADQARSLRQIPLRWLGLLPPTYAGEPNRSKILTGYGNALFNLGWRYELRRNLAEAVRCYIKSSRLGNPDATVRLTPTQQAMQQRPDSFAPPVSVMPIRHDWPPEPREDEGEESPDREYYRNMTKLIERSVDDRRRSGRDLTA